MNNCGDRRWRWILNWGGAGARDSAGLAAMVGLAVFVKVEKIGVTGGASLYSVIT